VITIIELREASASLSLFFEEGFEKKKMNNQNYNASDTENVDIQRMQEFVDALSRQMKALSKRKSGRWGRTTLLLP